MGIIEIIEKAKKTHEDWVDFFKKNPELQNTEKYEHVGDMEDHEIYIENYEKVLAYIDRLSKLLNRSEEELKKTCSCCAIFKDCRLPCVVNDLRTDTEQALKGK